GQYTVSTSFVLTVNAVNDAPTISSIANQTINVNSSTGPLSFTVGDVDTPVGSLTLRQGSSNETLVRTNNIVFGGSRASRTVTVVVVISDAGSGGANNVPLTWSDAAAAALPQTGLVSGTFRPANYVDSSSGGDNFPNPAPPGPYGATLSAFNWTGANGTWA